MATGAFKCKVECQLIDLYLSLSYNTAIFDVSKNKKSNISRSEMKYLYLKITFVYSNFLSKSLN